MKMKAVIVGAGMTRFGKYLDRSLKDLGREAVEAAMKDAGVEAGDSRRPWSATPPPA